MKYIKFESFDKTIIQCYLWDEVRSPKGVVQIVHGMAEHARRYDDFAQFLNKNNYIVFADDHRAHGSTEKEAELGYHAGDIFADTVKDELSITKYLRETYKLPVIVLGHSYGSFLTQSYIQKISEFDGAEIAGAVLSGTAYMKGMLINLGATIANVQGALLKKDKKAKLLDKLSFGAYNKPYKKESPAFGWLSRDKEQVKKYIFDPHCGYVMSIGFFKYFFKGLKSAYTPESLSKIDRNLKIAIYAGDRDPVGMKGKLPKKLFEMYKGLGMENVTIKLYEGARHEILNETNNKEVYKDMLETINGYLK